MNRIAQTISIIMFLTTINLFSQSRFVTIDGTKILINTMDIENRRIGEPVIVFESGLGTPMGHWDKLLNGVVEIAPLITYDRPGIGASEPNGEIPTLKNVSDRLVKILDYLDIKPPYVLVGHSLGGAYVRGFAVYYPELLAGLVIIDPADFTENKQNKREYYSVLGWDDSQIDTMLTDLEKRMEQRNYDAPESIQEERNVLTDLRKDDFKEIANSSLPNIPVHIITGGRFDFPEEYRSKEFDEELLFQSKMKHRISRWIDVIQSVDKGMFLYSGDAGHFVHHDDPELVISSIKMVIQDFKSMKK